MGNILEIQLITLRQKGEMQVVYIQDLQEERAVTLSEQTVLGLQK
jgi:hypothetical protein